MKRIFLIILICLIPLIAFAEKKKAEFDVIAETITQAEIDEMQSDLHNWTDQEVIETISQTSLTEDDIKQLYQKFRDTIVNPPNPDTYTEYSIENAEESLEKVERLGRLMQNRFLALLDEDYATYGKLIGLMREVLYIDWKHIPYAIRHNNARDIYWYELHNEGLKKVEEEYNRLFGEE